MVKKEGLLAQLGGEASILTLARHLEVQKPMSFGFKSQDITFASD